MNYNRKAPWLRSFSVNYKTIIALKGKYTSSLDFASDLNLNPALVEE
jgi:hypothetical protein